MNNTKNNPAYRQTIKRGKLPFDDRDVCDVCGNWRHGGLVKHHWKGYEYPDALWYICHSCNKRLQGRHDGSLTLDEAREYVTLSVAERALYKGASQQPDNQAHVARYQRFLANLPRTCPLCGFHCRTYSGLGMHLRGPAHKIIDGDQRQALLAQAAENRPVANLKD